MLSPLQPTKENTPSLFVVTIHSYQTRYPVEKCQFHLCSRHKTRNPGRELTKPTLLPRPDLRERRPQTSLFQTRQGANNPGPSLAPPHSRSCPPTADLHLALAAAATRRRAAS